MQYYSTFRCKLTATAPLFSSSISQEYTMPAESQPIFWKCLFDVAAGHSFISTTSSVDMCQSFHLYFEFLWQYSDLRQQTARWVPRPLLRISIEFLWGLRTKQSATKSDVRRVKGLRAINRLEPRQHNVGLCWDGILLHLSSTY